MNWRRWVLMGAINLAFYFWGMYCGERYIKAQWPPNGHCRSGAYIIGSEVGSWACITDKWEPFK